MFEYASYYCKLFINIEVNKFEIAEIINDLVKGEIEQPLKTTIIATWGEIDVEINKDAKEPYGSINDNNFLFWRYYLDIEPNNKTLSKDYINGIKELINGLHRKKCQVIAACDFEELLPKYTAKI